MHVVIEQEVLGLQVSMNDHVSVTVIDSRNNLLEELSGFRLVQFPLLDDVVEQLSARHKLHDHENVGRSGNNLVELDDVRMAEKFKILDLSTNLSDDIETFDFLPVEDFNCHFVLRQYVLADFDFAECAI